MRPQTTTCLSILHMRYQSVWHVHVTPPVRNPVSFAVSFDYATSARDIFHPSERDTLPFSHAPSSPSGLLSDAILEPCSCPSMILIRIGYILHEYSKPHLHEQLIRSLPHMYFGDCIICVQLKISILLRKSSLSFSCC